jgi:hypothetical protein
MKDIASNFNDIQVDGDRIFLLTNGLCDFKVYFTDRDNAVQYGRVNSWLVDKMFCEEDDYWEPFTETYSDWYSEIWLDSVFPEKELYQYVLNYFKKEYVTPDNYNPKQLDIFGELPEKRNVIFIPDLMSNEKERILDNEYFDWLKEHPKELGSLINKNKNFIELKRELAWAYDDAYNTAARDNIYNTIKEEVEDNFGGSSWVRLDGPNGRRIQRLKFDITKIFASVVNEYFDSCYRFCLNDRMVEDPEDYCDSCHDFEYSYFIDLHSRFLHERDDDWSPRFDEYPGSDEVRTYFSDSVYSRF